MLPTQSYGIGGVQGTQGYGADWLLHYLFNIIGLQVYIKRQQEMEVEL